MTCSKCGSGEIVTRYHSGEWKCDPWSRYTNNKRSGEHLHRYCQKCGYDWCDDVLSKAADSHPGSDANRDDPPAARAALVEPDASQGRRAVAPAATPEPRRKTSSASGSTNAPKAENGHPNAPASEERGD